jgi:hypothetical protein
MAGLQFSDTSGGQGLIQDCEDNLNYAPGGISGNTNLLNQFTRRINEWYQKVITMIFASQDDWDWDDSNQTDYPIATTNLVAGQQDYTIPVSLSALKIQRMEITFDGVNYKRINPMDIQSKQFADDTASIAGHFSTDNPYYDIKANSLWIYPIPPTNVTAGLRMWFLRGPLEFATTDTTKQPGIDAAFHSMISGGAAADFALIKNLPMAAGLSAKSEDWEQRIKQYYGRKDEDMDWQAKALLPWYE